MSNRYRILTVWLLIFLVPVFPIDTALGAEANFEKQFPFDSTGRIYLQNVSGEIRVSSWDKKEVRVEAVKFARSRRNLDDLTIEVTQSDDIVRIRTRHHRTFKWFWSGRIAVDYHMTVPQGASVEIKTVSGDSLVDNIGGFLEVKSVSGNLKIHTVGNGVVAHSVSGDISLTDIIGDTYVETTSGKIDIVNLRGSLEAESVSGDIEVAGYSDARRIRFETISGSIALRSKDKSVGRYSIAGKSVSGDIELIDFAGAREVELETLSGDILMRGRLMPNGRYHLDSHSGRVQLALPQDSDVNLRAKSKSGTIESAFETKLNGIFDREKVDITVGKGGADLEISTFSGNISIIEQAF